MGKLLQITIFSKNRAAQLDLFLSSLKIFCKDWSRFGINLIYRATTDEFKAGYDLIHDKYNGDLNFTIETDFKRDLLWGLFFSVPFTTFFCDDDIIKEPFELTDYEFQVLQDRQDVACLSLRLGRNITENYETGPIRQPEFIGKKPLMFEWRGQEVDWGYPMSISGGHIFRTEKILPLLQNLQYDQAWNIECALAANPLPEKYMLCYETSRVFQHATNRVQTGYFNPIGKTDVEELNRRYLKGYVLKMSPFFGLKNSSVHEIHDDKVQFL
jgi:hypothetical protein